MSSLAQLLPSKHRLDIQLSSLNGHEDIELFVEELPQSMHFASDCASCIGSASTTGGCAGGGSISSASTLGTMGSVVSTAS